MGRGLSVDQPTYELAHGISRTSRVCRKLLLVGSEALRHPLLSWRAAAGARSASRQKSMTSRARLMFNWLLVSSLARRAAGRGEVSLFDEGLFQGLWSFALEGDLREVEQLIGRLPDLVPLPDVVVVSRASPETLERRVRDRTTNDSRMDLRLEAEPELLQRGVATFERICDRIGSDLEGRVELLFVTNETHQDLTENVSELADRITAQT